MSPEIGPEISPEISPDGWDLVVVGAGPAGASTALGALSAAPSLRVLLLDRADFPRDKSCGDGIAPHALDVLTRLGLPDLAADHRPVHRLHLRYPSGAGVTGVMRRSAYVIPRATFDARILAGALAAGATFERRTVRRVEPRPDHVVLDGDIAARVVVAADGAEHRARRPAAQPRMRGRPAAAPGRRPRRLRSGTGCLVPSPADA